MARSQNGWTVVGRDDCDQGPFEGVRFPNGIRAGDVATIARWQLARYRRTVEPIVSGTCWGWYVKDIAGSDTISNHASGTAWDINATQHPMGPPTSSTMSPREIDACHAIERASEGTLRWGGDFSRPDPMHWEIDCTPAQAAVFARKIRGEDDLVTTQAEFNTLMSTWWLGRMSANAADNPERSALRVAAWQQEVGRTDVTTHNTLFGEMRAQLAAVYAATTGDPIDEGAIISGVLAGLTPERIAEAIPPALTQQVAEVLAARLAAQRQEG